MDHLIRRGTITRSVDGDFGSIQSTFVRMRSWRGIGVVVLVLVLGAHEHDELEAATALSSVRSGGALSRAACAVREGDQTSDDECRGDALSARVGTA